MEPWNYYLQVLYYLYFIIGIYSAEMLFLTRFLCLENTRLRDTMSKLKYVSEHPRELGDVADTSQLIMVVI